MVSDNSELIAVTGSSSTPINLLPVLLVLVLIFETLDYIRHSTSGIAANIWFPCRHLVRGLEEKRKMTSQDSLTTAARRKVVTMAVRALMTVASACDVCEAHACNPAPSLSFFVR